MVGADLAAWALSPSPPGMYMGGGGCSKGFIERGVVVVKGGPVCMGRPAIECQCCYWLLDLHEHNCCF
jgi:hypothetical protein